MQPNVIKLLALTRVLVLLQKVRAQWGSEHASAAGVPCCGNLHGWSVSPVNLILGIRFMQEGKSSVAAVAAAVFVLCCFTWGMLIS